MHLTLRKLCLSLLVLMTCGLTALAGVDVSGLLPKLSVTFDKKTLASGGSLAVTGQGEVTDASFVESTLGYVLAGSTIDKTSGLALYKGTSWSGSLDGYLDKVDGKSSAEVACPIAVSIYAKVGASGDQVLWYMAYGQSGQGVALFTREVDGQLCLSLEWASKSTYTSYPNIMFQGVDTTAYHHYVVAFDSSSDKYIRLYIDGVQKWSQKGIVQPKDDGTADSNKRNPGDKSYYAIYLGAFAGNTKSVWGDCSTLYEDVRVYAGSNVPADGSGKAAINAAGVAKVYAAFAAGRSPDTASKVLWTAGGGTDESVQTAANWGGTLPELTGFALIPCFAGAGSRALVDTTVEMAGIVFTNGDFSVAAKDSSALIRLAGTVETSPDKAGTYVIEPSIDMVSDTTVLPDDESRVVFAGNTTASGSRTLTMIGRKTGPDAQAYSVGGELVLTNYMVAGNLEHKKGGGVLRLNGQIGANSDSGTLSIYYGGYSGTFGKTPWVELGKTRFEGATVMKAVSYDGAGSQSGATGLQTAFVCAAGTTNVFKKLMTVPPAAYVTCEAGARVEFEKGVSSSGEFNLNGVSATSTDPCEFVFNGPLQCNNGERALGNGGGRSTTYFNATNNYARCAFKLINRIVFGIDDAFEKTDFYFTSDNAEVDLAETHQKVRNLASQRRNTSDPYLGTITGRYPSAIEVTAGAPSAGVAHTLNRTGEFPLYHLCTNCQQQVTGWVGLEMSGSGHLYMARPGALESFGDVTVSNGTLEFRDGTTWLNGTNVMVKGTGRLLLNAVTFGEQANFAAEGESWTIELAEGTVQRCASLTVDGQKLPGGTYGSAESAAANKSLAAHFAGKGVLRVKPRGIVLIVR